MKKIMMGLMVLSLIAGPAAFADVVVTDTGATTTTTTSAWRTVDTPIGTFFHMVGDVVAFPFHLIGGLF